MCAADSAFKLEALVSAREASKKEQPSLHEAARIRAAEIAAKRNKTASSNSNEN